MKVDSLMRKANKVAVFLLVFMFLFSSSIVNVYAADESGELCKDGSVLENNDTVSITDELTWRETVNDDDLISGVTITLPDGVIPNISDNSVDGMPAEVSGNNVTITSESSSGSGGGSGDTTNETTGDSIGLILNPENVLDHHVYQFGSGTQTIDIPCCIDSSKVSGGKITVAGISLNVDGSSSSNSAAPDTIELLSNTDGKAIATGDEVSLKDVFLLHMKWDNLENVKAGDYYEFELPSEIGTPDSDGSVDVYASDVPSDFPNVPFATLSWKAGDPTLRVDFLDMGTYTVSGTDYDALSLLTDATVDYE